MGRRLLGFALIFCCAWMVMAFVQNPGDTLIFSHKNHSEMEFDCLTCHGTVEESLSGKDNNLPSMDICMTCHDGETASEECEACHTDPDNPGTYPRVTAYHEIFSHKKHVDQGVDCSVCHYGVTEVDLATVANLPRMQICMQCHQKDFVPSACETCHEDFIALRPESHVPQWIQVHGDRAKIDQNQCADCHRQDFCQDCHQEENVKGLVHDLNYLYNHSLDARSRQSECIRCHESRDFCVECHREHLVLPVSHSQANWSNIMDGGRHRIEAVQDLESCIACHDAGNQNPICADCHIK